MSKQYVGFLNPGNMGVTLAASARDSGFTACWVSGGRSPETRARAQENQLHEVQNLAQLCEMCPVIVSVCPPHAAKDVAKQVLDCSYQGLYADVNAIAPQHALEIGRMMTAAGVDFVDGGIIGPPAWKPQTTWLYLAGGSADKVAGLFGDGALETEVIGTEIGRASALKMVFAALTKGSTALLCASIGLAEALGVRPELENQWAREDDGKTQSNYERMQKVTAKAWRFTGEMREIAATFASVEMPDGFHLAAEDIYQRMAEFKGSASLPQVDQIVQALIKA